MSDEKIFIGICNSQDFIPSDYFWSFIRIKNRWPTEVGRSRHVWDVVRNNRIIDKFLKTDCTILAKMDVDQTYPSDYFERFIPLLMEHQIVGPMIYDRWPETGHIPLAFAWVEGMNLHRMNLDNMTGLVEIPYSHTNLFYRREVLEEIPPPWYEAHLEPNGLERQNHVDFSFLRKIHQAGFKVMIDLDVEVKHMAATKFVGKADAGQSLR
jgi:hypothetical protein